jgi:hypothetical protein
MRLAISPKLTAVAAGIVFAVTSTQAMAVDYTLTKIDLPTVTFASGQNVLYEISDINEQGQILGSIFIATPPTQAESSGSGANKYGTFNSAFEFVTGPNGSTASTTLTPVTTMTDYGFFKSHTSFNANGTLSYEDRLRMANPSLGAGAELPSLNYHSSIYRNPTPSSNPPPNTLRVSDMNGSKQMTGVVEVPYPGGYNLNP